MCCGLGEEERTKIRKKKMEKKRKKKEKKDKKKEKKRKKKRIEPHRGQKWVGCDERVF